MGINYLPFSVSDATRKWFKDRYLKVPLSQKVEKQVAQIATTDINKVTANFLMSGMEIYKFLMVTVILTMDA